MRTQKNILRNEEFPRKRFFNKKKEDLEKNILSGQKGLLKWHPKKKSPRNEEPKKITKKGFLKKKKGSKKNILSGYIKKGSRNIVAFEKKRFPKKEDPKKNFQKGRAP